MSNLPHTAASPSPAMDEHDALPAGTRFGELEILRVVGVGGFGIVYLARDHSLDRDVALKEYMPGQLAARGPSAQVSVRSGSHMETFALGLRSFVNEARLLARFDHRSLVKVYRFWEANNTAYMVMPFLQGRTLREARRAMANPPDEAWMRQTINPLLEALELLHREAVYHRDIAPDNILLPNDGSQAVLLDFGAARRAIGDRTQTFTAILKPSYAPIEQYAESVSLRQGPWTDIYALGAAIHYLIKGVPPPPATARTIEDHSEVLARMTVPGVSSTYLAAVDWALAVRPQDRPQSVAEFRDALDGKITPPTVARQTAGATIAADPYVKTAADPVIDKTVVETRDVASALDEPTMLHRPGHGSGMAPGRPPAVFATTPAEQAASTPWVPPVVPSAVSSANSATDPTAPFKAATAAERPSPVNSVFKPEGRPVAEMGKLPGAKTPGSQKPLAATVDLSVARTGSGAWPVAIPAVLLLLAAFAWWWSTKPTHSVASPALAATEAPAPEQLKTPAVVPPSQGIANPVDTVPDAQKVVKIDAAATPSAVPPPPVTAAPAPAKAGVPGSPSETPKVAPAKSNERTEVQSKTAASTGSTTNSAGTGAMSSPGTAPRIVLEPRPVRNTANQNDSSRPVNADATSANAQRPQASPMWPPPPSAAATDEQRQRVNGAAASRSPEKSPDTPTDVCASRSFLTRQNCMRTECRSARFSAHPQCVQVRANEEAEEQRRVFGGNR